MSHDLHRVRGQAYELLSQLYLHGVTAQHLGVLQDVPDLAEHLVVPHDEDAAAAEHERLFGREVLPYASVFLEVDGNLGGDVTAAAARRLAAAGLEVPPSEPPDHLGHELGLLRALDEEAGEADPGAAMAPGGEPAAEVALDVLDGHLLWWVPALVPAIRRLGPPFWGVVADLTLDVLADHRRVLAGNAPPAGPPPWNLRGVPRIPLDDPTADLREVATFLTLPVRSGLYLAEADARMLGRSRRLPGGFGSRARVLETVFHSAVAYDDMPDLVEGLGTIVSGVRAAMEALAVDGDLPEDFVAPWIERLDRTDAMLERMGRGEGPVA